MTDTNTILRKVMNTTQLGQEDALLTPQQADKFLDYMWDATALGEDARTIRVRADTAEIEKIHIGERLLRVATEAVDDHVNAGVTFSKISISTTKFRLDWELSTDSLEDNLEGAALEDHIARLMATQLGSDMEDIAINGDATSADPALKGFDGWKKFADASGRVIDAEGSGLGTPLFHKAIKALPRRYKARRNELRFYAGTNLVQDYLYNLSQSGVEAFATGAITGTMPSGPSGPGGGVYPFAMGVPVKEVPMFDEAADGDYSGSTGEHGRLELTFPQNRVWAVKRDIQVYREFKTKKDTIEYTVFTRFGVSVENLDAFVVVKNVKVGAAVAA